MCSKRGLRNTEINGSNEIVSFAIKLCVRCNTHVHIQISGTAATRTNCSTSCQAQSCSGVDTFWNINGVCGSGDDSTVSLACCTWCHDHLTKARATTTRRGSNHLTKQTVSSLPHLSCAATIRTCHWLRARACTRACALLACNCSSHVNGDRCA